MARRPQPAEQRRRVTRAADDRDRGSLNTELSLPYRIPKCQAREPQPWWRERRACRVIRLGSMIPRPVIAKYAIVTYPLAVSCFSFSETTSMPRSASRPTSHLSHRLWRASLAAPLRASLAQPPPFHAAPLATTTGMRGNIPIGNVLARSAPIRSHWTGGGPGELCLTHGLLQERDGLWVTGGRGRVPPVPAAAPSPDPPAQLPV